MNIEAKHIGSYGGKAATIIELTVNSGDYSFTESITDLMTHKVDKKIIKSLRDLADELQEHNKKVSMEYLDEILDRIEKEKEVLEQWESEKQDNNNVVEKVGQ